MSKKSAIHVAGLSFAYPNGRKALEDVGFNVTRGENVGLVGPNGAGKTTLFLCLCGALTRETGRVEVAGLDPADASQRKLLPAKVGLLFQNSDDQLFCATVLDDIAFGPLNLDLPAEEVRIRVVDALAQVGLTGFEHRVPFHLSGGEKKRVALAGVLAMKPDVLLLDEPSLHLDPRGRRSFIRQINELDATKVIATHDLDLILETCERTIILDGGRIVADGETAVLLSDPTLMEDHGLEVPARLQDQSCAPGNQPIVRSFTS